MKAGARNVIAVIVVAVVAGWWLRFETVETQRAGFYLVNRWTGEVFLYNASAYQRVEPRVEKTMTSEEVFGSSGAPVTFNDIPADDSWYKNSPPVDPQPSGQ